MKAALLNALRKGTGVLLSIDSHEITLVPHKRVKRPGGVWDLEPQPARPPQLFSVEPSIGTRVIDAQGGVTKNQEVGANAHTWTFVLTGRHDAQIELNDVWHAGETAYRVVTIQPRSGYDTVAVVSAIGKDPNYGT